MTPAVRIEDLSVGYGDTEVLRGVSLTVAQGETLALLGPSGSGKTTLLYTVAGFIEPTAGEIEIGDVLVTGAHGGVKPEDRDIGMVFQNYALWPHMTALDTVAYPLRRAGRPKAEAREAGREVLALVGLAGLEERKPAEMSGGQQQRVGLARALARNARLYLFDEPTAHLDSSVQRSVQEEIARRRRDSGAAAIYATHDSSEALSLADRVAIIREGVIIQIGTPGEVYDRPVDVWAARLTGPASVLKAELEAVTADGLDVRVGESRVSVPASGSPTGPIDLLVRPEWVKPGGSLKGVISEVWYRGPYTEYEIRTPHGMLTTSMPGWPVMSRGDEAGWTIERAWIPDQAGQDAPKVS